MRTSLLVAIRTPLNAGRRARRSPMGSCCLSRCTTSAPSWRPALGDRSVWRVGGVGRRLVGWGRDGGADGGRDHRGDGQERAGGVPALPAGLDRAPVAGQGGRGPVLDLAVDGDLDGQGDDQGRDQQGEPGGQPPEPGGGSGWPEQGQGGQGAEQGQGHQDGHGGAEVVDHLVADGDEGGGWELVHGAAEGEPGAPEHPHDQGEQDDGGGLGDADPHDSLLGVDGPRAMPYASWIVRTWAGSALAANAADSSAKYSSSPPGVTISSAVAGPPTDRKTCGRLRGRNTNDPGPARNRSSPHSTSKVPVST